MESERKIMKFTEKQMTKEQSVEFYKSGAWESLDLRQRAVFQIQQQLVCMPFEKFHEAVEKTLGRPVWTHEFALNYECIYKELMEGGPAPTMEEIIGMLPPDKTIVVMMDKDS